MMARCPSRLRANATLDTAGRGVPPNRVMALSRGARKSAEPLIANLVSALFFLLIGYWVLLTLNERGMIPLMPIIRQGGYLALALATPVALYCCMRVFQSNPAAMMGKGWFWIWMLYPMWLLLITAARAAPSEETIMDFLSTRWPFALLMFPLIGLAGAFPATWSKLNRVFLGLSFAGGIIAVAVFAYLARSQEAMSFFPTYTIFTSLFLLFTFDDQSKKGKAGGLIALVVWSLWGVLSNYRNIFLSVAFTVAGATLFHGIRRRTGVLISVIFALLPLIAWLSMAELGIKVNMPTVLEEKATSLGIKMSQESGSRLVLWQDFMEDFRGAELLFGRGIFGGYKSARRISVKSKYDVRREIESGYLQQIMAGGLTGLGLFVLLALRGAYLGLFRSQNWLARGCALVVAGHLLDMVPYGVMDVRPENLLYWLCLAACYSKPLRATAQPTAHRILSA